MLRLQALTHRLHSYPLSRLLACTAHQICPSRAAEACVHRPKQLSAIKHLSAIGRQLTFNITSTQAEGMCSIGTSASVVAAGVRGDCCAAGAAARLEGWLPVGPPAAHGGPQRAPLRFPAHHE